MKKLLYAIVMFAGIAFFTSCEPSVKVTGWKAPDNNSQISKVVVMPLFEKLEYMKPFEQSIVTVFNSKGLNSIASLTFLNPTVKYPIAEIKQKCDSVGADAILVFLYDGTDKSESYIPPTTYYTGGYGGYWGGGYWGGYYGGYAGTYTTTGGYWTTTSIVNLTANLYVKGSKDPLWSASVSVTDPEYIDQAAFAIAKQIYGEWQQMNIIKTPEKK